MRNRDLIRLLIWGEKSIRICLYDYIEDEISFELDLLHLDDLILACLFNVRCNSICVAFAHGFVNFFSISALDPLMSLLFLLKLAPGLKLSLSAI